MSEGGPAERKRSKRLYVYWGVALALLLMGAGWLIRSKLVYSDLSRRYKAIKPGTTPEEVRRLFDGYEVSALRSNPFAKADADKVQHISVPNGFVVDSFVVFYRNGKAGGKIVVSADPYSTEDFPHLWPSAEEQSK